MRLPSVLAKLWRAWVSGKPPLLDELPESLPPPADASAATRVLLGVHGEDIRSLVLEHLVCSDGAVVDGSDGIRVTCYLADQRNNALARVRALVTPLGTRVLFDEDGSGVHMAAVSDPFGVAYAPAVQQAAMLGGGGGGGDETASGSASDLTWVTFASQRALVFVTDRDAGRVCAFEAETLTLLYEFGAPGSGWSELEDPCGCCFHEGVLYVADRGNARVMCFDRRGTPLRAIGGPSRKRGPSGPGTFLGPCGVAVMHDHLFVIDSMGVRGKVVQAFSLAFESPRLWIQLPFATRLVGVGCASDALYVCDMVSGSQSNLYRAEWAWKQSNNDESGGGPREKGHSAASRV